MGKGQRGGWQWADVPVPESHVVGLLVGGVLHVWRPVRIVGDQRLARAGGWMLIGIGLLIIGWAVRTIGELDGRHPTELATTTQSIDHMQRYLEELGIDAEIGSKE